MCIRDSYEEDLPYFCEQSFLPDDVLYGSNNPANPQNPPILLYRPQEALEGGEISRRGNFCLLYTSGGQPGGEGLLSPSRRRIIRRSLLRGLARAPAAFAASRFLCGAARPPGRRRQSRG